MEESNSLTLLIVLITLTSVFLCLFFLFCICGWTNNTLRLRRSKICDWEFFIAFSLAEDRLRFSDRLFLESLKVLIALVLYLHANNSLKFGLAGLFFFCACVGIWDALKLHTLSIVSDGILCYEVDDRHVIDCCNDILRWIPKITRCFSWILLYLIFVIFAILQNVSLFIANWVCCCRNCCARCQPPKHNRISPDSSPDSSDDRDPAGGKGGTVAASDLNGSTTDSQTTQSDEEAGIGLTAAKELSKQLHQDSSIDSLETVPHLRIPPVTLGLQEVKELAYLFEHRYGYIRCLHESDRIVFLQAYIQLTRGNLANSSELSIDMWSGIMSMISPKLKNIYHVHRHVQVLHDSEGKSSPSSYMVEVSTFGNYDRYHPSPTDTHTHLLYTNGEFTFIQSPSQESHYSSLMMMKADPIKALTITEGHVPITLQRTPSSVNIIV